jgi:hypothetical protein
MEELFDLIKEYGYKVRKNRLDGLKSWSVIKNHLQNNENIKCEWKFTKTQLYEMYNFIHDVLNMKGEENDIGNENEHPKHNEWEKCHFFLQLIRIQKNNDCNILRLCQIAYNIGQFKAEYSDTIYTSDIKSYFEENNLDYVDTYVNVDCFNEVYKDIISNIINIIKSLCNQYGGNNDYYFKYLKYKQKYLHLKNINFN